MKIIIVGANGYIGGLLYTEAKKAGNAIGTSPEGEADLYKLDLANPEDFDYNIIDADDRIILTAAISSPDICANQYDFAYSINVTGTAVFINKAIARGAKIVFFSSDTVYGAKDDLFDETASCNPVGQYGRMKHDLEIKFLENPSFKTMRLSYVVSAEDRFTSYLVSCAKSGIVADIFQPFSRSAVYRDDVIETAIKIANNWDNIDYNIVNLCGPKMISRLEIAEIFQQTVSDKLQIKITEPNEEFFTNRPRYVNMMSFALPSILGRATRSIEEIYELEFPNGVQNEN